MIPPIALLVPPATRPAQMPSGGAEFDAVLAALLPLAEADVTATALPDPVLPDAAEDAAMVMADLQLPPPPLPLPVIREPQLPPDPTAAAPAHLPQADTPVAEIPPAPLPTASPPANPSEEGDARSVPASVPAAGPSGPELVTPPDQKNVSNIGKNANLLPVPPAEERAGTIAPSPLPSVPSPLPVPPRPVARIDPARPDPTPASDARAVATGPADDAHPRFDLPPAPQAATAKPAAPPIAEAGPQPDHRPDPAAAPPAPVPPEQSAPDRPEAARPAAHRPEALPAEMVRLARTAPDGPVHLTLRPEELGTLRFELTRTAEGLHIHLSVDQPATLDLLRRQGELILAELRQSGFAGTTLSFAANDGQPMPQGDTGGGHSAPVAAPDEALPPPPRTWPLPVAAAGSLDLRL